MATRAASTARRPRRVLALAVVVVHGLAACGGDDDRAEVASDGPPPTWAEQLLPAQPLADQSVQVAVDGDQVVLAFGGYVDGRPALVGFASDEQGRFQPGEPAFIGTESFALGGIVRLDEDWVAVGRAAEDGGTSYPVRAFRSNDGRAWAPIETTGLEGSADVLDVVATTDGVVAVGALRTAPDPSSGPFEPVVWHSIDGVAWTASRPPMDGAEGHVASVTVVEDDVLAVGATGSEAAIWRSSDGGATWERLDIEGLPEGARLDQIAARDGILVATGSQSTEAVESGVVDLVLRSTDGGGTWTGARTPPNQGAGAGFGAPLFVGADRFFAITYDHGVMAMGDPATCYADIERCREGSTVALYASSDGDEWTRVDVAEALDGPGQPSGVIGTGDGRVVVVKETVGGVGVWTWPAGAALPTAAEPEVPTADVEVLEAGERPELGRRYAVPLHIHCGMEWLSFAGEPWQRIDRGADVETGAGDAVPSHWPVAGQTIFGFATLVADGVVEYSIDDDEVIATYGPATGEPPGCA